MCVLPSFGWAGELVSNLGWRLGALGLALAGLQIRRRRHAAVSLAAAIAMCVFPIVLSSRAPTTADDQGVAIRILVANLLASNEQQDDLLAMLAGSDADVLVLSEPPRAVRQALRPGGTLATQFTDLSRTRPERGEHAPIIVASRFTLVDTLDPGAGLNAIVLRAGDREVGLIATQLLSPRTPGRNAVADVQVDRVAYWSSTLADRGLPVIIAGDLNAVPSSHRSRRLAASTQSLRTKPRWHLGGSWPARLPAPLALPLDGALVSREFSVARWELISLPGSDHRGVLIELRIPSGEGENPRIPGVDP